MNDADLARRMLAQPTLLVTLGWEVVADRSRHSELPSAKVSVA